MGILQKLNDGTGYILRLFECQIKRRHEKGWEDVEFRKWEEVRERLNKHFQSVEAFEYGQYKYTGINRWCHNATGSQYRNYYYGGPSVGKVYAYTPNLKQVLKELPFAGVDFKKIFKGGERKRVGIINRLRLLARNPYMEYIQKSGLSALEDEILKEKEDSSLFDKSMTRIYEVLRLDKQRFQRFRKINGGCDVLEALQYETLTGCKVTDENMKYIKEKEVETHRVIEQCVRTQMSLPRMLNYLKRQQDITGQDFDDLIRHYSDYLDMAVVRGMDITDEIVCRQSRLTEFHARYTDEKNRKAATYRDKEVDIKYQHIAEDQKKNAEHFAFATKEYQIVVPVRASDITKEGRRQHHCVGASDTYIKAMDNRQRYIVFLRKKKSLKTPYYTVEIEWNGTIKQWYGAYDRKPDEDKIRKVLDQYTKTIEKREKKLLEKQVVAGKLLGTKFIGTDEQHCTVMAMAI